ncbi:MAG TPA: MFS transporter, partial [Burkholderiales bacterium]|nr:MFS transporter [Burkholderiales bacterium]
MTIGGSGMYSIAVALPAVQAEFGVARGDASLAYTLTMLGFGIGGILMGRLADRFGVVTPVVIGALGLGSGFIVAGNAGSLWQFSLAHGLLIGFLGCATTFAPLVADTSLWFNRRRGIAVAICASGNYLAGAVWPPILQHFFETVGWRSTYVGVGIFCTAAMLALGLALRRRPPALEASSQARSFVKSERPLGLSPNALMTLLVVAGVA